MFLAQLPEKCRSKTFLHPGREVSADTMEDLRAGMCGVPEPIVANGSEPLEIIGSGRSQQSIEATPGNGIWPIHVWAT
jgi:hypothetical protein